MPWDFVLWVIAMSVSTMFGGLVILILWGMWREIKRRK